MGKHKLKYICTSCERSHATHMGRCSCGEFGTIIENKEVIQSTTRNKHNKVNNYAICAEGVDESKKLKEVEIEENFRIISGINEFDRVMGGGIVRNSISIITAPPGAGKSTLLLHVANTVAKLGHNVVYATGEEADTQVRNRAQRILGEISDNLFIISTHSMENIKTSIEKRNATFAIVDSIQTVALSHIDSSIGGKKQVSECGHLLTSLAKNKQNPRAIILVGQMTKEDELAGPRELEHLIDATIHLEGDSELKKLVAKKNRFGDIGEIGLFRMSEHGLKEETEASSCFITKRDYPVIGSAVCVIKEGTRPIVVEMESSVSKSFTPFPVRNCENFKRDTLSMLTAVISKKAFIRLDDQDVLVKPTGDIRITESSANLATIMSIISSARNKELPLGVAFIGEVGLTGEIKRVGSIESRIKEVDRLGFKEVIIPNQSLQLNMDKLSIRIRKVQNIVECMKLFEM